MSKAFSFEIQGLKELDKMLTQLPKSMGKSVLRASLKKAAVPLLNEATESAPEGPTGRLANSMVIAGKLKKSQRKGRAKMKDGVEIFVGSTDPAAYLVEWGSVERFHKSGKSVGEMTESPFFVSAWDRTKRKTLKILIEEIEKKLLKAAKNLHKKAVKGTLGKAATKALR